MTAGVVAHSSSWTPPACEPGESLSEEEEDTDRWVDEYSRTWIKTAAFPGRVLARPRHRQGRLLGRAPLGLGSGCLFLVLEVSVVLASASFWSTLLLRGKRSSRPWELGSIVTRQSTEAFRRISFLGFLARAVRTWKYGALFLFGFVSGSHASCVWVLHVEYRKLNSSCDSMVIDATLGSAVVGCFGRIYALFPR